MTTSLDEPGPVPYLQKRLNGTEMMPTMTPPPIPRKRLAMLADLAAYALDACEKERRAALIMIAAELRAAAKGAR